MSGRRSGAGHERTLGHRDRLLPDVPRRVARSRRTRQDHRAQCREPGSPASGAAATAARAGTPGWAVGKPAAAIRAWLWPQAVQKTQVVPGRPVRLGAAEKLEGRFVGTSEEG